MTMQRAISATVAVIALVTLAGCGEWDGNHPAIMASPTQETVTTTVAVPEYNPDEFGGWTMKEGCNTRQRLIAEVSGDQARDDDDKDRCLDDGPVMDRWTGETIQDPDDADIDHVVPRVVLWHYGNAYTWTREQRVKASNDLRNLVVTSEEVNQRVKNDRTPDEWRPSDPAAWCEYRDRWVIVVDAYDVAFPPQKDTAIKAALNEMCPGSG